MVNPVDPAALRDTVEVVLRGADGEVKQTVGRAGIRSLAARMDLVDELSDKDADELKDMAAEEGVEITEGAKKKSNPSKADLVDALAARGGPLASGEILFEGERHEVKGPDPEVWGA